MAYCLPAFRDVTKLLRGSETGGKRRAGGDPETGEKADTAEDACDTTNDGLVHVNSLRFWVLAVIRVLIGPARG